MRDSEEQSIAQMKITYEDVYNPNLPFSQLDVSEGVQLSVVVDGCGIHKVLNEATECHVGDMYLIGSGVHHGYFAKSKEEKPTVCTLTFFPARLFSEQWADPESEHFCYGVFRDHVPVSYALLNANAMGEFVSSFSAITEELTQKDIQWQSAAKAQLKLLLIRIARYINMADTAANAHTEEWMTVSAAMRLIVEQCSDSNMTLETIAAALYVSRSHLSRMFPKVTGESFAEYVRKTRFSLACRLLGTTSLTNEQIVEQCGLKDVPTFYRGFKTYMGMTPYQYRMSQQSEEGSSKMHICLQISEGLQRGKVRLVEELIGTAMDAGCSATEILDEGLMPGMSIVGEKFKNNEVYVPEVLVAARCMNAGVQLLKPLLIADGVKMTGKVCIGTVQGDLHDIGKNIVKLMMEGKGLEVIDLGTDVPPEAFVRAAIEEHCQVICCSALLTTTMDVIGDVVKAAEKAGIRPHVKIMIGGAPITQEFCDRIGADVYTSDAASAADAAVMLCNNKEYINKGEAL